MGPRDAALLYLSHLTMWVSPRTHRPFRPATISRMFGTVKLLYAYAAEEGFLERNPAARIKRPPVPDDEQGRPYLTPLEFAAVQRMDRACTSCGWLPRWDGAMTRRPWAVRDELHRGRLR